MTTFSNILLGLVAFFHFIFFILEMFLWTKPVGIKVFGHSLEKALSSKILAANQGLYNLILVAGLIWGMLYPIPEVALQIKLFFLVCVVIAGVFGGYTVNKRILIVQALPGILAIASLVAF